MKYITRFAALLLALIAAATGLLAADPPPLAFADLYANLEQTVLDFEANVDASWNGVKGDTKFTASVGGANGHGRGGREAVEADLLL